MKNYIKILHTICISAILSTISIASDNTPALYEEHNIGSTLIPGVMDDEARKIMALVINNDHKVMVIFMHASKAWLQETTRLITKLNLALHKIPEDKTLKNFPNLTDLNLEWNKTITDTGPQELTHLRALDLSHNETITDKG